jgi:transposase-like protein
MDKLVKTLGIDSLSKSQVSRMAAELDEHVEQFRHRPLDAAGPFTFVAADALTMKLREGGRVINAVALLATGVNGDGQREVFGMRVATAETGPGWNEFFADLVARGLTGSGWSPQMPTPAWSRRSQPTSPEPRGSAAAPITPRT